MYKQLNKPVVLNNHLFLKSVDYLVKKDESLKGIVDLYGIPKIRYRKPGFATLLYIILEQQVSLASAKAVYQKLLADSGNITPEKFLTFDDDKLKRFGFSRQKTEYCRLLAESVLNGDLNLSALTKLDDISARKLLMNQKGIGKWTSDIYLLFALKRADIFPRFDLALITTVKQIKNLRKKPDENRMDKIAEYWKPWRSAAARLLWHHYLSK